MPFWAPGQVGSNRRSGPVGPERSQAGGDKSLHRPERNRGRGHRGQGRVAGNEDREAGYGATSKGARRRTSRWQSVGAARDSEVAEGRLVCGMYASPSIDLAPTCLDKFMAQRSLLDEAGSGERVVQAIRRIVGEQAHRMMEALTGLAERPSWRRTESVYSGESERVRGKEVGMVSIHRKRW
jgi:hypothetical protein